MYFPTPEPLYQVDFYQNKSVKASMMPFVTSESKTFIMVSSKDLKHLFPPACDVTQPGRGLEIS